MWIIAPRSMAALAVAASTCLGLAAHTPGVCLADAGPVSLIFTRASAPQVVVPRLETRVRMTSEHVTITPFFDGQENRVVLYVNARFKLHNPGPAQTLKVGFPEMKAQHYTCMNPASESLIPIARQRNKKPGSPYCSGKDFNTYLPHHRQASSPDEQSILALWASAGGRQLPVDAHPGKDDYRRWFVFDVALPAKKETALRNVYLAYPSVGIQGMPQTKVFSHDESIFSAEYVLHTGALWKGPIAHGVVELRTGGLEKRIEFSNLKPTRANDIRFALGKLNSSYFESTHDKSDREYLLRASSQRTSLPHSPASVLDGDPDTAWISGKGGVRSWIQLPLRDKKGKPQRVAGASVQGGPVGDDICRPRTVEFLCGVQASGYGEEKRMKYWRLAVMDLQDNRQVQEVAFKKSTPCAVLRAVVTELHGTPDKHVSIAAIVPSFRK